MEKHIHDLFNQAIIKEAAKQFSIPFQSIKKVGGFENFIYEYQKDNQSFILRFIHSDHRSLELVEAELDWVNYLAQHHASVSLPIQSINHRLVEKIPCHNGSYFTVTVFHKAKGTHVTKDLITTQLFENYGKTIGQFHALTKQYKENKKRYSWDKDPLIVNAKAYLPESEQFVYDKLEKLIQKMKSFPINNHNYGLIHTDIHMGNFFVLNNELTVFDFDDCCYHWFVSDIAIALFYYIHMLKDVEERKKTAHNFLTKFMKGYETQNHLEQNDFELLPDFLKLRELILYIVIYRSCDLDTDNWAKEYLSYYRNRILQDIPFVEID